MNLNSNSPSPFPMHQIDHDNDDHQLFGPNPSSSSSVSCHIFFNSTQDHHMGYYDHHQLYQPQHKLNKGESGLKLTLWKKEDEEESNNPVKWMSSKMRLMQKMKNPDRVALKLEDDQKVQPSSSMETDFSSSYSPIRVCADCNTTKTPLWRSGPKGPKSLCNACGIRQRKARRAMAAAAAATNGIATTDQPVHPLKIKVQHKEKTGKSGHASQLKKRCKTTAVAAAGSASSGQKKLGFEDFLINLSKKLAFHRMFPEDEKDAAILLMALSSGLVHG